MEEQIYPFSQNLPASNFWKFPIRGTLFLCVHLLVFALCKLLFSCSRNLSFPKKSLVTFLSRLFCLQNPFSGSRVIVLPVDIPDTQPESGISIALLDIQEVTEIWGVWWLREGPLICRPQVPHIKVPGMAMCVHIQEKQMDQFLL